MSTGSVTNPQRLNALASFAETCRMIKIEHSVFALPFALASAFIAANGVPEARLIVLIVLAMVSARSAAMAFNRYLDADIDSRNPRTAVRSIPQGRLTRTYALGFTLACAAIFVGVAALINSVTFYCSPVILLILLGYSYTKRFTRYCHFVLGLALGLSPLGAWLAVRAEFALLPAVLGLAVMLWTAGFDLIYSCQDIEIDRAENLFSLPSRIGISKTLLISRILHFSMVCLLVYVGQLETFPLVYWLGVAAVVLCLVYEHGLLWNENLENVNTAFFTMNGIVSIVYGLTTIAAVLLR